MGKLMGFTDIVVVFGASDTECDILAQEWLDEIEADVRQRELTSAGIAAVVLPRRAA